MKIYGKEDFNFMLPSKQEIIRLRNCILKEKIVFGMENINCCKPRITRYYATFYKMNYKTWDY